MDFADLLLNLLVSENIWIWGLRAYSSVMLRNVRMMCEVVSLLLVQWVNKNEI